MPPVMVRAAICCTVSIFLPNPLVVHPFHLGDFPGSISIDAHMSAAYSILGRATPSYSFFIIWVRTPFEGHENCVHASMYFVPFPMAKVACVANRSSWLMMTPKNFQVSTSCIVVPCIGREEWGVLHGLHNQ